MRQSRRSWGRPWFIGPVALAGLSALTLCLPATPASAGSAGRESVATATATGGLPVGGVLGDVTGDGLADILAIDPAGNLWMYPNTGGSGAPTFGARSKVGSGWTGYTVAAVTPLYGATRAGILAFDPAGNLWYYPNTGGSGLSTFGTRSQVGIDWTGYIVVGVADLNASGAPGVLAIAPSTGPQVTGSLLYYPGTGNTGLDTFPSGFPIGYGWTGYTADLADINGDGKPDILTVDPSGNLWLYPNNGSTTLPFADRSQVGSGWLGYQAIDAGQLTSTGPASMLAIDAAGNLWYYPNTGTGTFGARTQVGSGWTGYRIN